MNFKGHFGLLLGSKSYNSIIVNSAGHFGEVNINWYGGPELTSVILRSC